MADSIKYERPWLDEMREDGLSLNRGAPQAKGVGTESNGRVSEAAPIKEQTTDRVADAPQANEAARSEKISCGMEQLEARVAHNHEVARSSRAPATSKTIREQRDSGAADAGPDTAQSADPSADKPIPLALYFGYAGRGGGHFLRFPGYRIAYSPERDVPGFPWSLGLMDSGLLNNGKHPDVCDGRVFWTCGGRPLLWIAFYWWDRSGDKRPNSNSGFYVSGFDVLQLDEAFEYAKSRYPEVVSRQLYPLVLQPCSPRAAPAPRGLFPNQRFG